jgi:hypothetical protein
LGIKVLASFADFLTCASASFASFWPASLSLFEHFPQLSDPSPLELAFNKLWSGAYAQLSQPLFGLYCEQIKLFYQQFGPDLLALLLIFRSENLEHV